MSFAELEARVNAATVQHLSNAAALIGGVSIPVLFHRRDREEINVNEHTISTMAAWSMAARLSDFGGSAPAHGSAVVIRGETYTAGVCDISADGWVTVYLTAA